MLVLISFLAAACNTSEAENYPQKPVEELTPTHSSPTSQPTHNISSPSDDKWALWSHGARLRGANIWQRVVVPELDGDEFLGSERVGPPYTQADFNALAASGANYVNLSYPGLFTERPPYMVDEAVQANLDRLLDLAQAASLFAVITFRTGPGRSDFTFYRDGAGDWFDQDLLIETLWSDPQAQTAWVEMWRYTADRYKDHPVVVGYDLLCEPNSNDVGLGIYEPSEFYPQYASTSYDWNQFYPRLVGAIRQVDPETPILVSAMDWGAVIWLPYLQPVDDPYIIYTAHQYAPHEYTHQEPGSEIEYPGQIDLDWDGIADPFDRPWLETYLGIIAEYKARYGVPVAVNEYGLQRWAPGAAQFLSDELELFEQLGINTAIWIWDPTWPPWSNQEDAFNLSHGNDPENHAQVEDSQLYQILIDYWSLNTIFPP